MTTQSGTTMDALVTGPGNTAIVAQVSVPNAGSNEIRIKVHSIALNPVDALYAIAMQVDASGRVIGSDVAGYVDQIGEGVPEGAWKIGDRAAGLLQGATSANKRPGGFATYAILEADLAIRIPDDVSFDEAATLPLCSLTAAQALYDRLGLSPPFPFPEAQFKASLTNASDSYQPTLLIYSASTSLGLFVLELARLLRTPSGRPYRIITTASPRHHAKLRALGADAAYDYNDAQWAEKAKADWSEGIDYAVDCISEGQTTGIISQLFNTRDGEEKRIAVIRTVAWDRESVRGDVKALYGAVWEGLGHDVVYNGNVLPSPPRLRALAVRFYDWLSKGDPSNPKKLPISPNPVRLMPGGLERIPKDGFVLLGDGGMSNRKKEERKEEHMRPISGEKLVYRV